MQVDSDQRYHWLSGKASESETDSQRPETCLSIHGASTCSIRILVLNSYVKMPMIRRASMISGKNIIPSIIGTHRVLRFRSRRKSKDGCVLRDVERSTTFVHEANMDLVSIRSAVESIRRELAHSNSAKESAFLPSLCSDRVGTVIDVVWRLNSIVCAGTIISGGRVERSIFEPRRPRKLVRPRDRQYLVRICGSWSARAHSTSYHRQRVFGSRGVSILI